MVRCENERSPIVKGGSREADENLGMRTESMQKGRCPALNIIKRTLIPSPG